LGTGSGTRSKMDALIYIAVLPSGHIGGQDGTSQATTLTKLMAVSAGWSSRQVRDAASYRAGEAAAS
jgi:hypothetical protein